MASAPKFNAKNLHYEKQEPAFLRRLRGEAVGASGGSGDSDRLNVQHARPGKKPRLQMGDGDDEDGPTVVYEGEAGAPGGGNVGREEHEALMKAKAKAEAEAGGKDLAKQEGGGDGLSGEGAGEGRERERERESQKQKVADVGGVKKRKVGKVIGAEDDVTGEQVTTGGGPGGRPPTTATAAATATTTKSKPNKKQKKVKLSFDEPDS